MSTARSAYRDTSASSAGDEASQALRLLGSRAHQLRAATRAADHYSGLPAEQDRNTGSWLMSCAVGLAQDLAADIDGLARSLREGTPEPGQQQAVAALRVRAHQLSAADHFLEQDNPEDRETGSWMIACALGLAVKLAAELDDCVVPLRRSLPNNGPLVAHDAQFVRSRAAATGAG